MSELWCTCFITKTVGCFTRSKKKTRILQSLENRPFLHFVRKYKNVLFRKSTFFVTYFFNQKRPIFQTCLYCKIGRFSTCYPLELLPPQSDFQAQLKVGLGREELQGIFRNFEKFRNGDENFDIFGSFFLVYTPTSNSLSICTSPEKHTLISSSYIHLKTSRGINSKDNYK